MPAPTTTDDPIEPGSTVRLRSDSPLMTVLTTDGNFATLAWWVGGDTDEMRKDKLPIAALQNYEYEAPE